MLSWVALHGRKLFQERSKRFIEIQALNLPGLAMKTSSHGAHMIATRDFEFGEVIFEEKTVYDGKKLSSSLEKLLGVRQKNHFQPFFG